VPLVAVFANVVLNARGEICDPKVSFAGHGCTVDVRFAKNNYKLSRARCAASQRIDRLVTIVEDKFGLGATGGDNVFHRFTDDWMRVLPAIPMLRADRNLKLQVRHKRDFLMNLLDIGGIPASQLVTYGAYRVKTLLYPEPVACGQIGPHLAHLA
jgi:hypothetical protein